MTSQRSAFYDSSVFEDPRRKNVTSRKVVETMAPASEYMVHPVHSSTGVVAGWIAVAKSSTNQKRLPWDEVKYCIHQVYKGLYMKHITRRPYGRAVGFLNGSGDYGV